MPKKKTEQVKEPTSQEKLKARLDLLEDKYFHPQNHEDKISQWEVKELRTYRQHLWAKEESPVDHFTDEIYGGVEGVAQAINNEFPGASVHAVYVSDWMKGKRNPCNKPGVPPMPPSHKSGRHLRSLVFPWFREFVWANRDSKQDAAVIDNRARKEKADADMAEMAAEAERKRTSGLYILTEISKATGVMIGVELRSLTRDVFERQLLEKLTLIGIAQDMAVQVGVELFEHWQNRAVERLDDIARKAQS